MFKREEIINKVNMYKEMSKDEILEVSNKFLQTVTQFSAGAIIAKKYNISTKEEIESKVQEVLNEIPINIREALASYSEKVQVATCIECFSEVLKYSRLNNKVIRNKTLDEKYNEKGKEYLSKLWGVPELQVERQITKERVALPMSFVKSNKYLTNDYALVYKFYEEYYRYHLTLSVEEYKALHYSEDYICFNANIIPSLLDDYISSFMLSVSAKVFKELQEKEANDITTVAILLGHKLGLLNTEYVYEMIPGVCKERLLASKIQVLNKHRIQKYKQMRFTQYTGTNNCVLSARINEKVYSKDELLKLLNKILPYAVLSEKGDKVIYINKKGSIICEEETSN